jgi:Na+-driven multidrug efflux pump
MVGLFCKLAIPAVSTNIMDIFTVIVSAIYTGRMNDPVKLAAFGLAEGCLVILIKTTMQGLNSA